MEAAWRRHGGGMEAAWRRHGDVMEAAWRRHGGNIYATRSSVNPRFNWIYNFKPYISNISFQTVHIIRYTISIMLTLDIIRYTDLACKDDQSEPLCICLATIILS